MKKIIISIFCVACFYACAPRVVVASPVNSKTVVVKSLPNKYKVVRIRGKRYYKWNGRLYQKTRRGYVVVSI